eukprot:6945242-Prorocentrum_lima.AAC.1
MTSSLVGSEMCIRDSVICGCKPQWEPVIGLAPFSNLRQICGSVTPCSVSYTHLTLPTICSV